MLNISKESVAAFIHTDRFSVFAGRAFRSRKKLLIRLLSWVTGIFILICFLPWTQNIQSKGYVTTLRPDQRPQTINSIIAGKLEKWFVKEGDFVQRGDTILFISEIKPDYFDPQLVDRTGQQLKLKDQSITSYENKISSLDQQLNAFGKLRDMKMQQARNKLQQAHLKVKADSVDFIAAEVQLQIAEKQYRRTEELHKKGLKSLRDLEQANSKLQENMAKAISQENKLLMSRNEVVNAMIEITNVQNEYLEKSSKAEAEQFTVVSQKLDASSSKVKLENQLSNYAIRQGFYYITAPVDGYLTKLIRSGVGETIKEGEELMTIMPVKYDLAVEFYVDPMDYPLIHKGSKVRLQFDGWPAIVFRGWPNSSYGTYGGVIFAIDNFASPNGKFRVMAIPDPKDKAWPEGVRVGGGVRSFALLKDVPVWYELWRNMNGFPPEFYTGPLPDNDKNAKK